jgi:signal peptidase II
MSRVTSAGLAFALALVVFLADQGLKKLVEGSMRLGESIPVIPNVLYLTYTQNDGGAFGILGGQSGLLMFGSAVAVAFVLWMLLQGSPKRTTSVGCGLILGGAAGNLLDRLTTGQVTDYIDFRVWPVFNTADAAIVLGVATLLLAALLPEEGRPSTASNPRN